MTSQDSTRFLRIAAWTWLGFLLAMAWMDFFLYSQAGLPIARPPLLQQGLPERPPPLTARNPLRPVFTFYAANGLAASVFFLLAHWRKIREKLGGAFYPLLLFTISAAPIVVNALVTPRFPNGPLANAEGMTLRQFPILFVALALAAWEYDLPRVVLFSVAVNALDLGLTY
ncbi:MAG: hypothetical protein LDL51_09630, partial [Chloroflexi bacterium]|nr:hypothetical protein [Chloroflexota bacterium]